MGKKDEEGKGFPEPCSTSSSYQELTSVMSAAFYLGGGALLFLSLH